MHSTHLAPCGRASTRALCLAPLLTALTWGCTPHKGAPPSTPDEDGVLCIGLPSTHAHVFDLDPPHPLLLRGAVSAMQTKEASTLWDDLFVAPAHAYALDIEEPLAGAQVALYVVERAATSRDTMPSFNSPPKLSTTADKEGRFCFALTKTPGPQEWVVLVATHPASPTLHHVVTHTFDADINAMSEVVARALIAHPHLTNEAALNLRTMTETRLGLLAPSDLLEATSQRALIERAQAVIQSDETITSVLKRGERARADQE